MGAMCSRCFDGGYDDDENAHIGYAANAATVSNTERRRAALEAAERRQAQEKSRGHKSDPEFERLKHRQEKIDKAEEEVRKAGGLGNAPLSWQVN